MYEASVRVPLVVAGPAVPQTQRGRTVTDLTSLLDVFPTVVHLMQGGGWGV
jgi:arylsulfatase A-like enzyme